MACLFWFYLFCVFDIVCSSKKDRQNTYAIRNKGTKLCIRPHNANYKEDTAIIMYPLHNWECITWRFIKLQENEYLLQNLWTQKTLMPDSLEENAAFHQKTLGANNNQIYDITKHEEYYLIKIKDTNLYLTASSNEKNSNLTLMAFENSDNQKWELVEQRPIV